MPRPLSHRELIRKLRAIDFAGPFSGGRHLYMKRGEHRVVIPNPHGRDIGSGLIVAIIHEIGIPVEEFEKL